MENIAPYYKDKFITFFKETEIYKKLKVDYTDDQLIWDKFFLLGTTLGEVTEGYTPRESRSSAFSATIFYYLLPLLEKNPKAIYDLGCGKNMFKKYIPNIIGVGAEDPHQQYTIVHQYNQVKDPSWPDISDPQSFEKLPNWIKEECILIHRLNPYELTNLSFYGDLHAVVDDEYVIQYQNYFESVFAICSLHYCPLFKFKKIVLDFASMIQNNGRGFLSLNLQRMIDRTSIDYLTEQFGTHNPSKQQYDAWLRTELSAVDLKFLILDIDLTLLDEGVDGNIRLLIQK